MTTAPHGIFSHTSTPTSEERLRQREPAVLNSLGSGAGALLVLGGGGSGGGVEESGLCVVGAAGPAQVDGRGPLVQRRAPPFARNVAEAVLLWDAFVEPIRSLALLRRRLRVRVLDLRTDKE